MFYYLVSKSPLESSARSITPTEAWDILCSWDGNDFSMALPTISGEYIQWNYPYNTRSHSRSLYAFPRILDECEIGDL